MENKSQEEFIHESSLKYHYPAKGDIRTFEDWIKLAIQFGSELRAERAKEKIEELDGVSKTEYLFYKSDVLQAIEESGI